MINRRGESLYLVFGTSHPRGLEKMKEAVWEVDPAFGVRFRDPRDEQDEALFMIDEPQDAPLQRLLLDHLGDGVAARVEGLRRFALFETVYKESHVIPALERLRARGAIETDRPGRLTRASFVRVRPRG